MGSKNLSKVPMPEQAPEVRSENFGEVALGYTPEMAMAEAERCLGCKNRPCVAGCPVGVPIPEFISRIKAGEFGGAYEEIAAANALPAVCGRVCPQEIQCEAECVRGLKGEPVAIGRLERFAADWRMTQAANPQKPVQNGHRVAVVGAGPAGLTCAGELARRGCAVTVFEALHTPGGVLVYGIPEFRLPKSIVAAEIDGLKALGVKIQTNMVIGRVLSVEELMADGYEAVFIGTGAGLPSFMNIPGEGLAGVFSANEYLTRVNLMKAYLPGYDTPLPRSEAVAVVGGGNVAMDAARCAKRLGAGEVHIVYRRDEASMPARREEIHHAKEEGILFRFLTAPTRILGDKQGRARAMECVEMELGEPDESGRHRPRAKENSNFILEADTIIMAIGTAPNPLIHSTTRGLDANRHGCIVVEESNMATTKPGVYAGGDTVTGTATVILAMGAGKRAAEAIDKALN